MVVIVVQIDQSMPQGEPRNIQLFGTEDVSCTRTFQKILRTFSRFLDFKIDGPKSLSCDSS